MEHLPGSFIPGELMQMLVLAVPVGCIADQWVAEELKVNTDLMRAACVEQSLSKGGTVQSFKDLVTGPGLTPELFVDRHALAVRGMTRDGCSDFALFPCHLATDDCMIDLLDLTTGELSR